MRFIPAVSPVRIQVPLPNKGAAIFTAPFIWPVGQAVKTPPFHGGNMGSIPVRVTRNQSTIGGLIFIYFPRESMEAEVNDVSVTRQSHAPARPQARIPVRVTKIKNL